MVQTPTEDPTHEVERAALPSDEGPILVVDDDASLRRLCTQLLTARGYQVHTAGDGEEALLLVAKTDYRVVLLDLKMPGMDGLECLRRLKAEGCRAEIVMVTGYGNVAAAVDAMKAGACDFIEKPFKPEDLQVTLQDILMRRARKAELYDDPVVAYIQQHAAKIGSRKDVANRLGVSLERVSARIQNVTGQSFRQFLHACRLDMAKRLLETTELDISQISERTGFKTVQHFSRVFSKRAGVSPRNYRLQSRAQV